MRIPRSFCLLGHTITVRIVSNRDWEDLAEQYEEILDDDMQEAYGFWVAADNLIVLRKQKHSVMLHTFWHEFMHAVDEYANSSLTHEEIDTIGGLLAQAMSTLNAVPKG